MKKVFFICISMMLLLVITSCSNDGEVAKELIDYYNNEWLSAQKMKEENLEPKKEKLIELEKESNKKASIYVKEEIMPSMKEVLDYLHSIKLKHKEVEKLHQIHVGAEEFFYKGFEDGIANYKGEISDDKINENTEKLEEKYEDFIEYRDELMDKYDIVWDEDSYEQGYYKMKLKPSS